MSYLFENNKDHQFSQNLKILALQATRILKWYPPTPDWSGAKRSEHFAPNEAFGGTTKSWTHARKKGSSK